MSFALAWGTRVSVEFRRKVVAIAANIGFDPSWLMGCIAFETGRTFSPSVRNAAGSGATGLIQFMPSTAIGLGTTVDELARMTAEQQLEYVEKYFLPFKGRIKTFADCYMAILMPVAVGKPDDTPLIEDVRSKAYIQNKGLDLNADGTITKAEAASIALRQLEAGMTPENSCEVDAPIEERSTQLPPQPVKETRMDPLSIIGIFGPMLTQLIPQLAKIFAKPEDKKIPQYADALQIVLDTITRTALNNPTASGSNVGQVAQAIEVMKADPVQREVIIKEVLTTPGIMEILEVGGGVAKAREYDIAQQQSSQPFYRASAVFWISVILLPLVYWLVGSLIVGGIEIPAEWPWYAQAPFKLFGGIWNGESRSGGFNLVIGLVLGGICGVYFGVSVTQGRNTNSSGGGSVATERQP